MELPGVPQKNLADERSETYRKPIVRERYVEEMNRLAPPMELGALVESFGPRVQRIDRLYHQFEAYKVVVKLLKLIDESLAASTAMINTGIAVDVAVDDWWSVPMNCRHTSGTDWSGFALNHAFYPEDLIGLFRSVREPRPIALAFPYLSVLRPGSCSL